MVYLQEGDRRVAKIMFNSRLHPEREYRLSRWVYSLVTEEATILRSSLSKQVLRLEPEEWAAVSKGDISIPAAGDLAKIGFLVEKDFDDYGQYFTLVSVLRIMEKAEPGAKAFTILPTTACNARCVYCYQKGIAVHSMSPEIVKRTIEFILSAKSEGRIRLDWFGGEPLCASETISEICRNLRDKGVDYISSITTNASLFTPELIQEAIGLWNLKSAQVSMDGAKEDYETRKRYLRPDLYNYDRVMENVRLLAEAGVKVVIRCNCDRENMSRVYRFLDDCATRFGEMDEVNVYIAVLSQELQSCEYSRVYSPEMNELGRYSEKLNLAPRRKKTPIRLRVNQCMADSGGNNIIIDPEGGLYVCEARVSGTPLGSIFDPKLPAWPTTPVEPDILCRDCCFLPDCTPFRRNGCPNCPLDCQELMKKKTVKALEFLLKDVPVINEGKIE